VFRLNKEFGEQRARFTIAGDISLECIELLETCCDEALKDGKAVELILRDARTIDETGLALLRRLALKGVRLFAKGVYHSYLVESISEK
jgi:hypothetical protein